MRLPLIAALAAAALAGCGGGGDETTDPGPDPGDPTNGPLVVYQRGGGVAASYVKLTVAEDGSAQVIDGYRELEGQVRRTFGLRGDELDEVRSAVGAAQPLERAETETLCADCFEYAIAADGERVSFDDVDIDEGNVSAATVELRDLLQGVVDEHAPVVQAGG